MLAYELREARTVFCFEITQNEGWKKRKPAKVLPGDGRTGPDHSCRELDPGQEILGHPTDTFMRFLLILGARELGGGTAEHKGSQTPPQVSHPPLAPEGQPKAEVPPWAQHVRGYSCAQPLGFSWEEMGVRGRLLLPTSSPFSCHSWAFLPPGLIRERLAMLAIHGC